MTFSDLYYILLDMKTVNVRDLQHNLGSFLDEVARGETIAVRRRRKIVARLVPYAQDQPEQPWPDLWERLEQLYPDGPLSVSASELLSENRGDR